MAKILLGEGLRRRARYDLPRDMAADRRVSPYGKLIWMVLADFAFSCATVFPSRKTIGGRCGLNETAVKRHLPELEEAGWLIVERHAGKPNSYTVEAPALRPAESPECRSDPGLDRPTTRVDLTRVVGSNRPASPIHGVPTDSPSETGPVNGTGPGVTPTQLWGTFLTAYRSALGPAEDGSPRKYVRTPQDSSMVKAGCELFSSPGRAEEYFTEALSWMKADKFWEDKLSLKGSITLYNRLQAHRAKIQERSRVQGTIPPKVPAPSAVSLQDQGPQTPEEAQATKKFLERFAQQTGRTLAWAKEPKADPFLAEP